MKYDVIIIGGGPAGMMAAGRAGELGSRVLLLEKNKTLGLKLLITGKGRCNITNQTDETKEMIKKYGKNGKFLFSSMHKFGVEDVVNFFNDRHVKTKVERGDRVFPVSDFSLDVLEALIDYLKSSGVIVKTRAVVKDIIKKGDVIEKIILDDGEELEADKYIICTGGKSYPKTGSTGDGYDWLKKLGHKIVPLMPSLTSVVVKEKSLVERLEGLSLKNVEIGIYKDNKKIDSRFGEALFTHEGMSGPIVLDMSKRIGEEVALKNGAVELRIDFKASLDFDVLDKRIQRDFEEGHNRMFKNSLDKLLPQKLIPVIIDLCEIDPEKELNMVFKEERKRLVHLLKEFRLEVERLSGYDKAIVTAGGVELNEIDPKTMQSKIVSNLYLAGEMLDLDGPTGGYNLQVCWSTGYTAGEGVIK